ncbi:MAG: 3-phosphoshikimate 1-carboxyvinyltransferase [Lachnospiraceae bacterium]|nr:3-phosphoshikimate 1-carboxyvinyltransferase [Lachnospiraceae bacterium]
MIIERAAALRGTVKVPGDKSISHRSVMLGSIAEGTTYVRGFLNSADCQATIACFRKMGIRIEELRDSDGERVVAIYGKGLRGLTKSPDMLDAMNSGTTTRLIAGILAGQPFDSFITGDASLRKRPMKRIIDPLSEMGCHIISANDDNCLPLKISGGDLHAIRYHSNVASAQVKSCVLLAALYAEDPTFFYEPSLSRNHTELMLGAFGANLKLKNDTRTGEKGVIIYPGTILRGQNITVPGDISSAAYFIAAGLLVPKSEIRLTGVGINETRDGILRVVRAMGGDVRIQNVHMEGREPVADLVVRSSELKACSIGGDIIPALIDELPVIAVMAACAGGITRIRDASELRVKESDRLRLIVDSLRAMGVTVEETDDGMDIYGMASQKERVRGPGRLGLLQGAEIDPHLDHRMAMACAVAGLISDTPMIIKDADCVKISYPRFYSDLDSLRVV